MRAVEGDFVLNLLAVIVFEIFKRNHFVTVAEAVVAEADNDDSIMRNAYVRVPHKNQPITFSSLKCDHFTLKKYLLSMFCHSGCNIHV